MVPVAQTVQRKCAILNYLLSHDTITTGEATTIIDLDSYWASRLLHTMHTEGHICNIAPYGKRKVFSISPDKRDLVIAIVKHYFRGE